LLFALLALASMLLAAVALVRSVDSGALVLGNLGFKQDATSASDAAAERARAWLLATPSATLAADSAVNGYYASSLDALDVTGRLTSSGAPMPVVNWGDSDSCACVGAGTCSACSVLASNPISLNGGRVTARYLITRLCPAVGAVSAANACAKPASTAISQASARGEVRVGSEARPTAVTLTPYYRIVVRTVSARNTVSFTETILH
jgi:hypothetical protein